MGVPIFVVGNYHINLILSIENKMMFYKKVLVKKQE